MPQTVAFELDIPDEFAKRRPQPGVNVRLQKLLDRQDQGRKLSTAEKREARGLVSLAVLLSLLNMRASRKPVRATRKLL